MAKSDGSENIGVIRSMAGLLQRWNLARRAGLQFGGKRDLYKVFGYPESLQSEDLYTKYLRQDITSRVVDAPVHTTWASPPVIEASNPAFTDAWNELVRKHHLWSKFMRADKLASLGRYSCLLIGINDTKETTRPVSKKGSKIIYLTPLAEASASITEFEQSRLDPRFGKPKIYDVSFQEPSLQGLNPSNTTTLRRIGDMKVHHSRILHIVHNPLEDEVYGTPVLVKVYNLLEDILKVAGGTAETYWLTANKGIQANIDKEMELDKEDTEALSEELEEYQHQLRRIIRTRGVEIKDLGSSVPDPRGIFSTLIALLSGTTGIPQRILIGSEAGQLASEQDRANWAERIHERRTELAGPIILEPFLTRLIEMEILPDPGEYDILWPDAFRMSPLEQAQMMAQKARAVSNIGRQWDGKHTPMITVEEGREIIGFTGPFTQPTGPPAPNADPASTDDKDEEDPAEIKAREEAERQDESSS